MPLGAVDEVACPAREPSHRRVEDAPTSCLVVQPTSQALTQVEGREAGFTGWFALSANALQRLELLFLQDFERKGRLHLGQVRLLARIYLDHLCRRLRLKGHL